MGILRTNEPTFAGARDLWPVFRNNAPISWLLWIAPGVLLLAAVQSFNAGHPAVQTGLGAWTVRRAFHMLERLHRPKANGSLD